MSSPARPVTTEIVKQRTEDVIAITRQPIRSIEDLRNAYERLRGRCNLLTPITDPGDIPQLHRVSLGMVVIDTTFNQKTGAGRHVYHSGQFHSDDEVSLNKIGLLLIMQAAGLSIIGLPQKTDDGSDPHYSKYSVRIGGRDLRGIWRVWAKDGVCDYRDGSQAIRGWLPKQLASSRAHIDSRAETKALEKCIRDYLAIQGQYKVSQASLPFVVPVLLVDPDINNPADRQWLLNQGSTVRQLYGAANEGAEEVRQMKDVTPPPPLPAAKPDAQLPPGPAAEDDVDDDDQRSFDLPDLEEPERFVCGCPCNGGCQAEVSPEAAKITKEKVGAVRCGPCYPAPGFDALRHKELDTLGLPLYPKLDAAGVLRSLERMKPKKA